MRTVSGAVIAAVVLFLWGFLFWATPVPYNQMAAAPDDAAAGQALLAHFPESGTYILPAPTNPDADRLQALHEAGPIATVFLHREGAAMMDPVTFVLGFLHMLASALLVAALLRMAAPALPAYGSRVAFVALFGVAVSVWSNFGDPIWWRHPWDFHLLNALYYAGAWTLAGLVLARFVHAAAPAEAAETSVAHA